MITLKLAYWEERAILSLAEKINAQRQAKPDRREKHRQVIEIIDANPLLSDDRLCKELRRAGLYSRTTYDGDIISTIRTQRRRGAPEAKP